MADSPALNAHSRTVLIPLPRAQLPSGTVVVPGPGPIEPGTANSGDNSEPDPSPPVPLKRAQDEVAEEDTEDASSENGRNDDDNYSPQGTSDPYANLDGAFGNYLADAPHPMSGSNSRTDDLLF